jgi:hypothetical protein
MLRDLEAAHLSEVLARFGLCELPAGSTPDSLLLQTYPVAELRRRFLQKLPTYIGQTRSAETT